MKLVVGETGRNPKKNLSDPVSFTKNPNGVTETRTRDPSAMVGGERLIACAKRPLYEAHILPIPVVSI